jgi:hypothetical protein
MVDKEIYLGNTVRRSQTDNVQGSYVEIDGENFYRIGGYDQMDDFFISVVSDSNHWMFISTRGGLTAGRVNSESALFPYYSDDKVSDGSPYTGSRTLLLVTTTQRTSLWEPFSESLAGIYDITRNLYKNILGDKLIFEEINHDLNMSFRYAWRTSDRFGFVKTSKLTNLNSTHVAVEILDGIENIIPYGVESAVQNELSCLVDAYKKHELDQNSGLAVYSMSSILVDRAEPSEALSVTSAWSEGLPHVTTLLSSDQLNCFRQGLKVEQESDIRGRRGAYFVNSMVHLLAGEARQWNIVAEVNQGPAKIRDLIAYINENQQISADIDEDIALGSKNLARIVGTSDGFQVTEDRLSANHHFANVLFNVMRGGLFADNYWLPKEDLAEFIRVTNKEVSERCSLLLEGLGQRIHYSDLIEAAERTKDLDIKRLCYEYLPLSFSRRHGDPSRPWNKFNIEVKKDDGSELLNYEGNWRDIFQNWEALSLSIPNFVESMICKFVNASTADGYNPYRITKNGIDWEKPDPSDPWANIGYWGDHQIIYLLKFLELSKSYHPGTLKNFLTADLFCYANVPYRIKAYEDLLVDPHNTIDFDETADRLIQQRVASTGSDGRLLWDTSGSVYKVNLTEKLLVTMLAKLSNFVPEAGIWMNTQRPEWNDANNALVGFGVSMVTLYYTRRFQQYLRDLFSEVTFEQVVVSAEVVSLLDNVEATFNTHRHLLQGGFNDSQRKSMLDQLGVAASDYRASLYDQQFSGDRQQIATRRLLSFIDLSIEYIDHTIAANRREDGLYHAYNLMTATNDGIKVSHLYEMLEGQVAVLSSGYLNPEQALDVLVSLRNSAVYTERQHSYLLYPDRELTRFVDKNIIPKSCLDRSELLKKLIAVGDQSLVESDASGGYYFNGGFNSVDSVSKQLEVLSERGYGALVESDKPLVEEIFESVFNHRQFTGRSGGMYAYEGLGSIYWHMVSKLLLAALENFRLAVDGKSDPVIIGKLADCYFDIRAGIGFNKKPGDYGAFPTDPYSHTPGFAGAKQPGMTGQVKEEVITRLMELGVSVKEGSIYFDPFILRKSEFLSSDDVLCYFDVDGDQQSTALRSGQIGFTFCQVPVVYTLATETSIGITFDNGRTEFISGNTIDADISMQIFDKKGVVTKIEVALLPGLE